MLSRSAITKASWVKRRKAAARKSKRIMSNAMASPALTPVQWAIVQGRLFEYRENVAMRHESGEVRTAPLVLCFTGVEELGPGIPGRDYSHPAYSVMRRLAWEFRDTRDSRRSEFLQWAIASTADRIKERPGVNPEDVDAVIGCLTTSFCRCERCYKLASGRPV